MTLDINNPYVFAEPTVVSFSGGRTSAYMLYQIVSAHGGVLPPHVVVCFANTGKEREQTLRFVHECGVRWGVQVYWLEWRDGTAESFAVVDYNSADREGRVFSSLIKKRRYLPNAVARFCTQELKIRPMRDFCRSLGWTKWTNVIGLRHDEGHRVLKALARNDEKKERFTVAMPLAQARVTKRDHIMPFWLGQNADPIDRKFPLPQGFDLGLRDYEGNCDLCFLKSRAKLIALMREHPGIEQWWIDQEQRGRFVTEYSYQMLREAMLAQGHLFDVRPDQGGDDHDVECGLLCGSALPEC